MRLDELKERLEKLPTNLQVVARYDYRQEPVSAVVVIGGTVVLLPYEVETTEVSLEFAEMPGNLDRYGVEVVAVEPDTSPCRVTVRGPDPSMRSYIAEVFSGGDLDAAQPLLDGLHRVR